ncbi:4Fe-4S cluster-binding domain-containing protein, partial [Candidatus Falkowbacteria bacterium]|nr:4Fe-4S cluster-binding domain-containing protein [Candidatus Falkowbacteria bacterium]
MLAARLSPHLQSLTQTCPAIARQFVPSSKEENNADDCSFIDPLLEEEYTVTRGLVHKYGNRALLLLTMNCAAYCRFCTRRRKVSDIKKGLLTDKDIKNIIVYLKKHPLIKEIIVSGGDPLTVPTTLKKVLSQLTKLPQIKIIRIGTRVHVAEPSLVNENLLKILRIVKKQPLYLMVHFEHPSEITPAT